MDSIGLADATVVRGGRPLLNHASFTVGTGVTLVEGAAALSTVVLEALAGAIPLDGGQRLLDGAPARGVAARRALTMVPARSWEVGHLRVRRALLLTALLWELKSTQGGTSREIARWGLSRFLGRRMAELSRGEERRVLLAASLAPSPTAWIVDGGADSLDAEGRVIFAELLTRVHLGLPGAPRIAVVSGDIDARLANTRLRI